MSEEKEILKSRKKELDEVRKEYEGFKEVRDNDTKLLEKYKMILIPYLIYLILMLLFVFTFASIMPFATYSIVYILFYVILWVSCKKLVAMYLRTSKEKYYIERIRDLEELVLGTKVNNDVKSKSNKSKKKNKKDKIENI